VLRGFDPQAFTDTRVRRGLSVSDLARLSDVMTSTIHNWVCRYWRRLCGSFPVIVRTSSVTLIRHNPDTGTGDIDN
jgi:transposase-like protein